MDEKTVRTEADSPEAAPCTDSLQITTTLKGDGAAKFRKYKTDQFLERDAEVARKLILERLSQLPPAA